MGIIGAKMDTEQEKMRYDENGIKRKKILKKQRMDRQEKRQYKYGRK